MSCASRCGIVCTTVVSQKAPRFDFYGRAEREEEKEGGEGGEVIAGVCGGTST